MARHRMPLVSGAAYSTQMSLGGIEGEVVAPIAEVDKGVLSAALNYNSSATVRLWHVVGGTETDTGIDVTAYDWLLKSGQSVPSGTRVTVRNVAGRWYVDGAQC